MDLVSHISNKDWNAIIKQYSPKEVVALLSYEEAMKVADAIFLWNHRDDDVINYVINTFIVIREIYPEIWEQDWKNDLYMNEMCEMVLRYQEILDSCKRVYEKQLPDPPALVSFSLANCYFLPPEVDTISQEEAINLFKESFEKQPTYEAASLLRNIYGYLDDKKSYDHWDAIAEQAKRKNLHIPIIVPDIFKKLEEEKTT